VGPDEDVGSLRLTVLLLIIYGYLLMLCLCLIILFYTGVYFGVKARTEGDSALVAGSENNMLPDIEKHPTFLRTMETMKSLRKKGTIKNSILESSRHADTMECGLCYETFVNTDAVFNCTKMHVFHTNCYEDSKMDESGGEEDDITAMLNICPTCGSSMNI